MPFDTANLSPDIAHVVDPTALYRERRERATALWRSVPQKDFSLTSYKSSMIRRAGQCGTTACALGWLAEREHDGWHWAGLSPTISSGFLSSFSDAAAYFGMRREDTGKCFGVSEDAQTFYGRSNLENVTPTMVADALLALPYATA